MKKFPTPAQKILPAATTAAMIVATLTGGCNWRERVSASEKAGVIAPSGTTLRVRLNHTLDTRMNKAGDRFTGILAERLNVEGKEALPAGTTVVGKVLRSQTSGREKGRAVLALTLEAYERGKQSFPLATSAVTRTTVGRQRESFTGNGGGSGTSVSAASAGDSAENGADAPDMISGAALSGTRHVAIPAESVLSFTLTGPTRF